MFIPIIPRNPKANNYTCRDGEIEYVAYIPDNSDNSDNSDNTDNTDNTDNSDSTADSPDGHDVRFSLTEEGDFPTAIIRIPLEEGDEEKVALMLQGQISRVDVSTTDRIMKQMLHKAAQAFQDLVISQRHRGLHILPFRVFARIICPDGSYGHCSAQAVIVPSDYPPHPEITAHSIANSTLTLSLRFTVRPRRLQVKPPAYFPEGYRLQTCISYPMYIPDPDETTGTLGSVRSALGGNATGIRFSFLSETNMKYSVALPDKYHEYVGNEKTGYKCSGKAAEEPDYTTYLKAYGKVEPFSIDSLRAEGSGIEPSEWAADWEKSESGYYPTSLPYICRDANGGDSNVSDIGEGVNRYVIDEWLKISDYSSFLMTRPMMFADAELSKRNAAPKSVRWLRILGLPESECLAVMFGSADGVHYKPLRQFNPHCEFMLNMPPRLFQRLMLLGHEPFGELALEVVVSHYSGHAFRNLSQVAQASSL